MNILQKYLIKLAYNKIIRPTVKKYTNERVLKVIDKVVNILISNPDNLCNYIEDALKKEIEASE